MDNVENNVPDYTKRKLAMERWTALLKERSTWDGRWQDIGRYVQPFAARFYMTDRDLGSKDYSAILDNSPTRASNILAAGMMSGNSSPARPWIRLKTPDPQLNERHDVKVWFSIVQEMMLQIFSSSNTYRSLHSMYEQLGLFGTAPNIVDDNYDTVIWNTPLTIGEYCLGVDGWGRANTLYRKYEKQVSYIVERYVPRNPKSGALDWTNVSQNLKNMWDTRKYDAWVPLIHAIQPRAMAYRDPTQKGTANMPFSACVFELNGNEDKTLHESGYERFPVMAPRWHTYGSQIYGVGPGHNALGDIKQLQHEQGRKSQAIDFQTLPPIAVPGDFKGREIDKMPGGVTPIGLTSNGKVQNLFEVTLELQALLKDIQDVRARIDSAFFADLFLMLINSPSVQPVTATEIAEKKEEKLLMLGPVLERLNDEMLTPLVMQTFYRMVATGILPPPPPALQGSPIKVEYISVLQQAQRAVGVGSVDKIVGTIALISESKQSPEPWDKIDTDVLTDKYADMLGVDPSLIVGNDKVAVIRASRQQAAAQAQAAQAAPAAAAALQNLAKAHESAPGMTENLMGYS